LSNIKLLLWVKLALLHYFLQNVKPLLDYSHMQALLRRSDQFECLNQSVALKNMLNDLASLE
jgi:hypothetical protein